MANKYLARSDCGTVGSCGPRRGFDAECSACHLFLLHDEQSGLFYYVSLPDSAQAGKAAGA